MAIVRGIVRNISTAPLSCNERTSRRDGHMSNGEISAIDTGDGPPRLGRGPRHVSQALADALAWVAGLVAADVTRHDFDLPRGGWADLAVFVAVTTVIAVPLGYAFGL